jgi:phosphoenolpyruvate synthase/pyruvate phosphate dikinase
MNAMLSVSLAMARGLAHLKGQDLYEMLRGEMLAIIEKLAQLNRIKIKGSRFTDYVNALIEVNQGLETQGKQLHEVLRNLTGIYSEAYRESDGEISWHAKHLLEEEKAAGLRPTLNDVPVSETETPSISIPARIGALTAEEESLIADVNTELFSVYRDEADNMTRHDALHLYIKTKQNIARRTERFGIVNNRVFITSDQMFIPYLVGDTLVVFNVHNGISKTVLTLPLPNGKIFTDELLQQVAGLKGNPIDLENDLCFLEANRAVPIRVGRIRDFVEHLRSINESANRSEAVYVLRNLVARLSLFSFKKQLNAKNLQSEVHSLFKELKRFINSPLSDRLPFLVRILVRDIAAVVTRPKLIDRLWNETISLAEIHIRGSAIVNELRRSTHHAMGRHTLKLASAYLNYLKTGERDNLNEVEAPELAPADEKARKLDRPIQSLERIIDDLEQLLGSSETIGRIREWQAEYEATLIRCEFGKSFIDEMNEVVDGMRDRNRWVYYHHLRIIKSRLLDFTEHLPSTKNILQELDYLLGLKPDDPSFDREHAEEEIQKYVDKIVKETRMAYQTDIFNDLDDIFGAYDTNEFYTTFKGISQLRKNLRDSLDKRAFPEQRLMLLQLDCLLEEMSYLALRQIASEYEEKGVDFAQCLEIIHACVLSLTHDGLHSRQLHDLAAMLRETNRTYAEVRNILEQIHRNYHHLIQRVITPFERKREKIGFSEEEIQAALANMKRYMHDLNSIAYFTDIAHSFIETKDEDETCTLYADAGSSPPKEPIDVIHLSHRENIKRKVENDDLDCNLRNLYGSKGSGLIYISYLNLPTRDGFILPTTLAKASLHGHTENNFEKVVIEHLKILEADIAKRDGVTKTFGSPTHPLLVAVRGGSVFSMPGILSTVLFVGMNDEIASGLAVEDPWCAYDAYRRFLAIYGQAVWGVDMEAYNVVEEAKRRYKVKYKYDLPWEGMKEIAERTKEILREKGHGDALEEILRDPIKQLFTAIQAVFRSWDSDAAQRYREIKGICNSWQTVAIVQEMALGNRKNEEILVGMNETRASLTGVIPRTRVTKLGLRAQTGDFKFSAAGEDLVGGLTKSISFRPIDDLITYMPMLNRRLRHNVAKLRRFMGTDQEVEFTVETGVLSILQSRAAEVGKNRQERAFEDPGDEAARGIGIRGSAFRGIVAFDKKDLDEISKEDLSKRDDVDGVILLLESPAPEQIPLILSADALLAAKGGSTSHAAIAINGIEDSDYSAVMSAAGLHVNARKHEAVITAKNGDVLHLIRKFDIISIHGTTGNVYVGTRPTI